MRPGVAAVVKSRNHRAQTNPPHNTFSMVLYTKGTGKTMHYNFPTLSFYFFEKFDRNVLRAS